MKNYAIQSELIWSLARLFDGSDRLDLNKILFLINEISLKMMPAKLYEHLLLITSGNKGQQVQVFETMVNGSQFK